MRRSALRRSADAGFTLIELLIVIIILGILAAIVVFSVTGITDKGKTSACKAGVNAVNVAIEADYAQNGTVAKTIGTLVTDGFLHADSTFTTAAGASVTVGTAPNAYTITMNAPGAGVTTYNATGSC